MVAFLFGFFIITLCRCFWEVIVDYKNHYYFDKKITLGSDLFGSSFGLDLIVCEGFHIGAVR
jgi:hypothetical protein